MLIYEKAEKKPLKLICSPENINLIKAQPRSVIQKFDQMITKNKTTDNLSCDGTAIPRDTNINDEEIIKDNIDDNNN